MNLRIFLVLILLFSLQVSGLELKESKHRFVVIGASNTAESPYSQSTENGSYIHKLRDSKYNSPWSANIDLINNARDGMTMADYFSTSLIRSRITTHLPTFVMIVLGGNDFLAGDTVDTFSDHLQFLVDTIMNQDTSKIIKRMYIANIYGADVWKTLNETELNRGYAFQDAIASASQNYGMKLLDFFNATNGPYSQADGIHLTDIGMIKLASYVNETLAADILDVVNSNSIPQFPTSTSATSIATTEEVGIPMVPFISLAILSFTWKKPSHKD